MSINHQFLEFNDRVVKRYVKTVLYRVSGWRVDPHRPENRLDFLLITPEKDIEFITQAEGSPKLNHTRFSYDDEVLELYSDTEARVFERWNKSLIERGLIKEYTLTAPSIDNSNMLTDRDVKDIANIRQLTALKKRLSTITSDVSLIRIKEAATELDRSINVIKTIEGRINELSATS